MPSADGFIKTIGASSTRFHAAFMIDDITYNLSGSFASSVPPFTCNDATLNYTSLEAVTSTRSFEGHVGPSELTFNLANGPTINAVLEVPLGLKNTVSGSGVWIQN